MKKKRKSKKVSKRKIEEKKIEKLIKEKTGVLKERKVKPEKKEVKKKRKVQKKIEKKKKHKVLRKEKIKSKIKPEIKIEEKPLEKPRERVERVKRPERIEMHKLSKHKALKKGTNMEEKKRIGGGSFIASGIVVMLVPAIFYIVLGDFNSFLQNCALPFSTVDIDGMILSCTELRFVYVLSYFCLLFGSILVIFGLAKKIIESKK